VQFKHYTNLAIFMLAVCGDQMGNQWGNAMTYTAMAMWLEQTLLINIELKISGWLGHETDA
jgi:hypothetical protein